MLRIARSAAFAATGPDTWRRAPAPARCLRPARGVVAAVSSSQAAAEARAVGRSQAVGGARGGSAGVRAAVASENGSGKG